MKDSLVAYEAKIAELEEKAEGYIDTIVKINDISFQKSAHIERLRECQARNYGNATQLHLDMITLIAETPKQSLDKFKADAIREMLVYLQNTPELGINMLDLHIRHMNEYADNLEGKSNE